MNIKNDIYCKSALNIEQLECRKKLNKTGIEIQLLSDFVDNPLNTVEYIEILGDNIKDVKVVHTPLKKGEEIVEIQMLTDDNVKNIFERVCELSQAISDINGEDILIVIHNRVHMSNYLIAKDFTNSIIEFLNDILKKYPSIRIGIENIVSFMNYQCMFANGAFPDYVDIVKYLREELKTNRIGSVLDTCHAISTMRILSLIEEYEDINFNISIKDYFKVNKDICFLIHLANVKGLGFNKNTHGIGFEGEEDILKLLIDMYKEHLLGVPITLELIEFDYLECDSYKNNYDLLMNILSE